MFGPKPDKDIVIDDINEASLAALSKEYGRWPWPRQVLGEFLENLELQKPKAVVFDILFSDPDVFNPDSDAYFDEVVATTTNTFFPVLRLDEASDSLSQIKPSMIPGVTPIAGKAQEDATIAVVLPFFPSILEGGRLGLHNIYPDQDGVAREYLVYRDDYGWRIPSLPTRVIRELGYRESNTPSVLLNWRGQPFSYTTVSFSDVFNDMISREKKRPQNEFTNKVILIGSTAPSLFDIKPTPMSRLHPGVEIMATAIDNLKRGDYLRNPEGRILYPSLTLLIIWLIAVAFFRDAGGAYIDRMTGGSEFTLLAVSYASINFGHTYINLTGPITIGLAFFAVTRLYAAASSKTLETSVLRASVEQEGDLSGFLLLIRVGQSDDSISEASLNKFVAAWRNRARSSRAWKCSAAVKRASGLYLNTPWRCPGWCRHKMVAPVTAWRKILRTLPARLRRFCLSSVRPKTPFFWKTGRLTFECNMRVSCFDVRKAKFFSCCEWEREFRQFL
ncbi:MAG: CHASE2 domain-containing protein, partial [Candidatus Binatia bacterium]|nr:CHASE2 domain-containing protein [Candidatus Binatia bacterium]